MLRPPLIAVGLAAVLAGCAMNTGVLPLGPDTYRIQVARAPILGGGMEAQKAALTQAQEYCAAQQKEFVTIATDQPRDTRFEVDFRCCARATET
jgi:predicted naringenin-chalcone synthase